MEDIIVVKPGIEATIYFRHTCTQCSATLDIKDTITEFKCPGCGSDETCTQSPEAMVKKYDKAIGAKQNTTKHPFKSPLKKKT
jgi:predicted RNA-binding Zn-ribbon protein involved in translation (DUF1610 family)